MRVAVVSSDHSAAGRTDGSLAAWSSITSTQSFSSDGVKFSFVAAMAGLNHQALAVDVLLAMFVVPCPKQFPGGFLSEQFTSNTAGIDSMGWGNHSLLRLQLAASPSARLAASENAGKEFSDHLSSQSHRRLL